MHEVIIRTLRSRGENYDDDLLKEYLSSQKTLPVGIRSFVSIQAISKILSPSLEDKPVVSVSKKISFIIHSLYF